MSRETAQASIARAEGAVRTVAQYQMPEQVTWSGVRAAMLESADALRELCGEDELPVELAAISELRRILHIRTGPLTRMDASLVVQDDGFAVLLRQNMHAVRRRATLAHEIGHTFFYDIRSRRPERIIRTQSGSRVKEEDICWAFAQQLLMPVDLVEPLTLSAPEGRLALARGIASRAGVSMEWALKSLLHSFPSFDKCIVIVSVPDKGKTRRVARYWGRRARVALPASLRDCADDVKNELASGVSFTAPRFLVFMESAGGVARDNDAVLEWIDWNRNWGGSVAVLLDRSHVE